jgi:RimK family alpha-L-glutamate ligase
MNMKNVKIALFFGGKISQHLVLIKKAAKKMGVRLDLVSYNRVFFDTENLEVGIRNNLSDGTEDKVKNEGWLKISDYDVLFFRTTGKHWEEVDLIVNQITKNKSTISKIPIIIDPIVLSGKPSMACKAHQMLALKSAGIDVPKTVYGSLWYLFEKMRQSQSVFLGPHSNAKRVDAVVQKNTFASDFNFPIIIKGSGGDRGTRVFKADNVEEMEKLVRDLRKTETEEGKRYMLQEFIPNDGDYRVLVLGKKVLGVMKRSSQSLEEFKNNYSAGGKVEVATLPQNILDLAVKAAEVCGLAIAGVDVAFRDFDINKPVIWEVNKGPQFKGFMQATGINVPEEIVKYLVSLKK